MKIESCDITDTQDHICYSVQPRSGLASQTRPSVCFQSQPTAFSLYGYIPALRLSCPLLTSRNCGQHRSFSYILGNFSAVRGPFNNPDIDKTL